MKIASNKAFYTYGAQSAPRATADVGDTCMKRLTILIFVWAIFFCASTAFCEIPNEYRDLLKDNIHIRYYCPRCGRTLDLDAEKNTAMVNGGALLFSGADEGNRTLYIQLGKLTFYR